MKRNKPMIIKVGVIGVAISLISIIYYMFVGKVPLKFKEIGRFDASGISDEKAVAEIVKYHEQNGKVYLINGEQGTVEIFLLEEVLDKEGVRDIQTVNIKEAVEVGRFEYGDITSIDINEDEGLIAVAVQHKEYTQKGSVLFLDEAGSIIGSIEAGVQPDMLTFTPDGKAILVANEGEAQMGYGDETIDPEGSISYIDLSRGIESMTSELIRFTAFDQIRDELVEDQVLLRKGSKPSEDLEPEYITVTSDSKKAYIALQEANAIATINLVTRQVESIIGLGFKDHSLKGNEIDMLKDGDISIVNQDVYGAYMPDGIDCYTIDGKNYIVTANEGDGRAYVQKDFEEIEKDNEYTDEKIIYWGYDNDGDPIEVKVIDADKVDGIDPNNTYLYGARSFSIFEADTMRLVWDSGSDFEVITSQEIPDYFNTSHNKLKLDNRSGKKGPEPEDVKVGIINERYYAFIGLERIGGVMMYDITDPSNVIYQDYINTRDFSKKVAGDSGPEGLEFISAEASPTGMPLLLVANEVSETVVVLQVE